VQRAAEGLEVAGHDELAALDFLLGAPIPSVWDLWVTFDTPKGPARIKWTFHAMDGRKIDRIEQRNRNDNTGIIDQLTADSQIVAEGSLFIADATGREVKLTSDEFLTVPSATPGEAPLKLASPADAIEARFRTQLGIIGGIAREIRKVSGWDIERIGKAQRRLADAAGN
jgi:hypothetical protein